MFTCILKAYVRVRRKHWGWQRLQNLNVMVVAGNGYADKDRIFLGNFT